MILILLMATGIVVCCFILMIFALVSAGRRADEGEQKLFELISPLAAETKLETKETELANASVAQ